MQPMSLRRKQLLRELEGLVGGCYNPNSTTAVEWGRSYDYGCSFHYPVTYKTKIGTEVKYFDFGDDPDESTLMSGFYKFGSNHLPVFKNLELVLRHLEKKYNIKFD